MNVRFVGCGFDCLIPAEKQARIMAARGPQTEEELCAEIEDKVRDKHYRGPIDPGQLTD